MFHLLKYSFSNSDKSSSVILLAKNVTVKNSNFFNNTKNLNKITKIKFYSLNKIVTKEDVQQKMKESSRTSKRIDKNYIVYEVSMGLFSSSYYYVKTPKGNFYSVSKKSYQKTIDKSIFPLWYKQNIERLENVLSE